MQQSDNRTTDALTRRYGFNALNAVIDLAGMTKSAMNHRIGCPIASSPQPRDAQRPDPARRRADLRGHPGTSFLDVTHRNLLYGYMSGGPIGEGALRDMIIAEAEAAGLTDDEVDDFVARVSTRSKGGSYDSCPNFAGGGSATRTSRSAARSVA